MIRVRCQQSANIDVKGRLALPAPIRRALEEAGISSLVLTYGRGGVWAWSPEHWERAVEDRMMAQDTFAEEVLDFAYAMMASAQDVAVDNAGRVRLPSILREQTGIIKEVIVHVVLGRIEIWDKAQWEERFKSSLARTKKRSGMPLGTP